MVCRSRSLPEKDVVDSITEWFPRLHSLVVGPGLGRDPVVLERVKKIMMVAKEMQKNLIIDAVSVYLGFYNVVIDHFTQDGIYLIVSDPDLIVGYTKAIITPNGGEFPRLYEKMV